jgi:predicted phage terminase large subunit-like protein
MGTHTAGLSEDFGRRVRNLIESDDYHELFSETVVADDQKAAGKWSTSAGGQYYAAGVGGALAGRGADLFVIDDPHSEQDVKANSRLAFDTAWSWFQTGPLQRLMPGGAIIIIMTRWGKLDLTGRLLDYQTKNPESEPWEVVELPAILHENTANEKSLWPEQWPLETLKQKKASLDPQYWNAQYMQNPVSNNAAIISRKLWRVWQADEPPRCDYIIQSWDTAFEAKTSADYSACTTWGVFYNEEENDKAQVILLDAFKDRMAFPELKAVALKHYKEWQPDAFIVEKKAAGAPLIQELRNMGIPVQETNPSRGNDKITRVNAIADLFASGMVWAPDTRWAREVIEEVASFPNGDNDDYVDTTSQALLRFRQGGFIALDSDEPDEPKFFRRRSAAYY